MRAAALFTSACRRFVGLMMSNVSKTHEIRRQFCRHSAAAAALGDCVRKKHSCIQDAVIQFRQSTLRSFKSLSRVKSNCDERSGAEDGQVRSFITVLEVSATWVVYVADPVLPFKLTLCHHALFSCSSAASTMTSQGLLSMRIFPNNVIFTLYRFNF